MSAVIQALAQQQLVDVRNHRLQDRVVGHCIEQFLLGMLRPLFKRDVHLPEEDRAKHLQSHRCGCRSGLFLVMGWAVGAGVNPLRRDNTTQEEQGDN